MQHFLSLLKSCTVIYNVSWIVISIRSVIGTECTVIAVLSAVLAGDVLSDVLHSNSSVIGPNVDLGQ